MRNVTDLLARYAAYHRDRRNIISHFVGVPMIVFAMGVLLARPSFVMGEWLFTPAVLLVACTSAWYLTRGDIVLGAAVSASVALLAVLGHHAAHAGGLLPWLTWGVGTFLVGWLIQFAGHWYEGRKPAFVDDVLGLLVGPMFVVAEALFHLGWNKRMQAEIERRVGPTSIRDLARIAA